MATHGSVSVRHRREILTEEEDASIGRLGPEFTGTSSVSGQVQPLLISEVRLILNQRQESGDVEGQSERDSSNPIYKKTMDYVDLFSRYKTLDTVKSVREEHLNQNTADVDDLMDENAFTLTGFEAVQLADLAIDNVEEAKTLIPTLASKDDEQLNVLLQEMVNIRRFQA